MSSKASLGAKKALVINSASSILTIGLQITFLVWVNRFLLQRVAPEEYAIFPLVMSLVFFADVFKRMLTGGLSRYIVEADAKNDDQGVTRVVSSMMPFLIGGALLIGICGALAVWKIDNLLTIEPEYLETARAMFGMVVIMLLLGVVLGPFAVGLYAKQRFVLKNGLDLAAEVVRISLLAVLLIGVSASVLWLVVASMVSVLLRTAADVICTRRLMPAVRFRFGEYDFGTARSLLGFGAWTSVGGVVAVISRTVPLLLLNRFGTALDVTCFHVGRLPDLQLRKVISAGLVPIQPAMTSMYAHGGLKSLGRIYFQGNRYTLWLALVGIAPLVVFARPIVDAYIGSTFMDAALVMGFLLGRYPLIFASGMFYRVAHASGKIGQYFITEIIIQIATLIAMYVTVVRMDMGAVGAAASISLAACVLQLIITWPLGLRLIGKKWSELARRTLLPGLLPFVATVGFCYAYQACFDMSTWHMIGIGAVLSVGVFALVIRAFCLQPEDRDLVDQAMRRLRSTLAGGRRSPLPRGS